MAIMTRFVRIWKADVNGVMDQLEDRGLLLKQSLRDMEDELERKEKELGKMQVRREQVQHEQSRYLQETEKLEQDLEIAIDKQKDDIARMVIKKLMRSTKHRNEFENHLQALDSDIKRQQEILTEQMLQYEQLKLKSREYFQRFEHRGQEDPVFADATHRAFDISCEPTEEEIELELLKRKEAMKNKTKGA